MDILLSIGELPPILMGANYLADGAASVAKHFRTPSIVIGLIVMAFGASAPEPMVSVSPTLRGSTDIAVGNAVGGDISNTLMIVDCTAPFTPIVITRNTLRKEIPLCTLSSIILLICANSVFLDKAPRNTLSISGGLILLYFFIIFLGYIFVVASRNTSDAQPPEEEIKNLPIWKSIPFILGGLGGPIFEGQRFVEGASDIIRNLSVDESVIGLTPVTGGTFLPELITSIVATLKRNPKVATGSVIGSNLFDIFFVLEYNASIIPLQLASINNFDLFTLIGSGILLWFLELSFAKHTVTRIEGNIPVLYYIAYTTYLICQI